MHSNIFAIIAAIFSVIGMALTIFQIGDNYLVVLTVSVLFGVVGVVVGSFLVTKEEKRRMNKPSMPSPSYTPESMKPYKDPNSTTILGDGTNARAEGTTIEFSEPHMSSISPEWLNDPLFSSDHTVIIDDRNLPYGSLDDLKGGRKYRLDRLEAEIGRSQPCRIVILDDRTVSKRHAILRAKLDQYGKAILTIEDLSSSNGTIVNGKRIRSSEPAILHNEDVITIGKTELKFQQYPYFQEAIEKMSSAS